MNFSGKALQRIALLRFLPKLPHRHMHPDRAHTTDVAIAEKILQIAQPWREPALGAENGLHTSFCRKVDQFTRMCRAAWVPAASRGSAGAP